VSVTNRRGSQHNLHNNNIASRRFGDGHAGRGLDLCRGRRLGRPSWRVVRRPQRGRSAGRPPVGPMGRTGRSLLEAAAPQPKPHALRTRHLRVQSVAARDQMARRYHRGE